MIIYQTYVLTIDFIIEPAILPNNVLVTNNLSIKQFKINSSISILMNIQTKRATQGKMQTKRNGHTRKVTEKGVDVTS